MKTIDDDTCKNIDSIYKQIGLNVKKARELQGITQLQLALAMNLKSVGLISQAEIYHKRGLMKKTGG